MHFVFVFTEHHSQVWITHKLGSLTTLDHSQVWITHKCGRIQIAVLFILCAIGVIVNVATGVHRIIPLLGNCVAVLIGYAISYDRAGIR